MTPRFWLTYLPTTHPAWRSVTRHASLEVAQKHAAQMLDDGSIPEVCICECTHVVKRAPAPTTMEEVGPPLLPYGDDGDGDDGDGDGGDKD